MRKLTSQFRQNQYYIEASNSTGHVFFGRQEDLQKYYDDLDINKTNSIYYEGCKQICALVYAKELSPVSIYIMLVSKFPLPDISLLLYVYDFYTSQLPIAFCQNLVC